MWLPTSRVLVFAAALGGCASQHGSQLDGPVDFQIEDGFIRTDTVVHIELDGSATMQVRVRPDPATTTSGTVDPARLDALRAHIAAVDLASFRGNYVCEAMCSTDAPIETVAIHADGVTKQIRVDRGLQDGDLPDGLLPILIDLNAIAYHLR